MTKIVSLYKPGHPSKQSPPERPGKYYWKRKKTGKVDYAGETCNLKRRRGEHLRSEKPISLKTHDFEWKGADGRFSVDARREDEKKTIRKLCPPLNMRAGGGGRKQAR